MGSSGDTLSLLYPSEQIPTQRFPTASFVCVCEALKAVKLIKAT